jgi:hypothetical protein
MCDNLIHDCSKIGKTELNDCGAEHKELPRMHHILKPYYNEDKDFERLKDIFENGLLEKTCLISYSKFKTYIDTKNKDSKNFELLDRTTIIKIEYEVPINSGNYILGFCDCKVTITRPKLETEYTTEKEKVSVYYIEVKTTIPSFGELMRQINTYKNSTRANWIVISPDDRFATHIKDQGIGFYKWESSK